MASPDKTRALVDTERNSEAYKLQKFWKILKKRFYEYFMHSNVYSGPKYLTTLCCVTRKKMINQMKYMYICLYFEKHIDL